MRERAYAAIIADYAIVPKPASDFMTLPQLHTAAETIRIAQSNVIAKALGGK